MTNIRSLLIVGLLSLSTYFLQSCTEEIAPPGEPEAKLMTIDEIKTTKGFTWFQTGYDKYTFDSSLVLQIKNKLLNTDKTFLVFVNPSCACTGTQEHFPAVVKILRNAGIEEPKFKVYTMNSPDMKNPFTNIFKINYLPAFFIMKDNLPLKSVFDSLSVYRQSKDVTIEESFLKCLN